MQLRASNKHIATVCYSLFVLFRCRLSVCRWPPSSPIADSVAAPPRLTDSHGRVIHDLRVSITDRCNYKCVYCRTGEVGAQYP
jgi:hypothetical protein